MKCSWKREERKRIEEKKGERDNERPIGLISRRIKREIRDRAIWSVALSKRTIKIFP